MDSIGCIIIFTHFRQCPSPYCLQTPSPHNAWGRYCQLGRNKTCPPPAGPGTPEGTPARGLLIPNTGWKSSSRTFQLRAPWTPDVPLEWAGAWLVSGYSTEAEGAGMKLCAERCPRVGLLCPAPRGWTSTLAESPALCRPPRVCPAPRNADEKSAQ